MIITIKTPPNDLRSGDKVYVAGLKKPVMVVSVDGRQVRYAQGKQMGVAIQKQFDRVVNKISEVIR